MSRASSGDDQHWKRQPVNSGGFVTVPYAFVEAAFAVLVDSQNGSAIDVRDLEFFERSLNRSVRRRLRGGDDPPEVADSRRDQLVAHLVSRHGRQTDASITFIDLLDVHIALHQSSSSDVAHLPTDLSA